MLEAVRRLAHELPVEARLIRAPTIPLELLEEEIDLSGLPVRVVSENRFAAIADSHVALCASGTATLEVGLLGTPMVMLYRLGTWTWLLAKLMVRLPFVSLVNLVLGRKVVPELLQGAASPDRIALEVEQILLDDREREEMRRDLAEVRGRLGSGGASGRAAREIADLLLREAAA
jgi:lipid-A-disaccharide synthase